MEILTFIGLTFAVYRLSTDFAWMSGPFHVFDVIRGMVLQKFGMYHWVTEGVNCPICLSFWFSLPLIYTHDFVAWLSIAGASAFAIRLTLPKD
jgi:hypothetical protein